ncbi:MAG: DUF192 domain-containing protein [Gemmatimonadales bacterium]|nr:MAG: DUF192 domain-containing protein [Gemmatimonadales bacterium]
MTPDRKNRLFAVACVGLLLSGAAACTSEHDTGRAGELRAEQPTPTSLDRSGPDGASLPRPAPATAWVIFGADTVVAEIAQSEEERARGLMYRETLAENAGMLFVFPESSVRSFWMQNTYIALDIAFMDPSFRIVDIQQMEPMTTDSHMSRAPAMYALEVNQGWFEAHGVEIGDLPEVVFGR